MGCHCVNPPLNPCKAKYIHIVDISCVQRQNKEKNKNSQLSTYSNTPAVSLQDWTSSMKTLAYGFILCSITVHPTLKLKTFMIAQFYVRHLFWKMLLIVLKTSIYFWSWSFIFPQGLTLITESTIYQRQILACTHLQIHAIDHQMINR